MIDEELIESYKLLVKECIEQGFPFRQENRECGLARKVTDIYLVDCPHRCEFKCMTYPIYPETQKRGSEK